LLPTDHRERAESDRARTIADYVAGMTDRYAILEHRRLFAVGEVLIGVRYHFRAPPARMLNWPDFLAPTRRVIRHHVIQRGNNRQAVFADAGDFQRYLQLLQEVGQSIDGSSRLRTDDESRSFAGYAGRRERHQPLHAGARATLCEVVQRPPSKDRDTLGGSVSIHCDRGRSIPARFVCGMSS